MQDGFQTAGRLDNNLTGRREAPGISGLRLRASGTKSHKPQATRLEEGTRDEGDEAKGSRKRKIPPFIKGGRGDLRIHFPNYLINQLLDYCLSRSANTPCLGGDWSDDVVFTEANGNFALLAAHDGAEDADASAFWIPVGFTGVIGQKQLQAYFRAFR